MYYWQSKLYLICSLAEGPKKWTMLSNGQTYKNSIKVEVWENDYSHLPRPHCMLIKAVLHQVTMSQKWLEIPKAGKSVPYSIITRVLRQQTHPSFYKRKTHNLKWFVVGRQAVSFGATVRCALEVGVIHKTKVWTSRFKLNQAEWKVLPKRPMFY